MAANTTAVEVKPSSAKRFRPPRVNTAISAPIGTATSTITTNAMTARFTVFGSRAAMVSPTGSRLPSDTPRSPVNRCPRYRKYWTISGSSRPSSARLAATRAGSAVNPSAARIGSPGTRWMIRNENVTSAQSEISSRINRRRRNAGHGPEAARRRAAGAAEPVSVVMVIRAFGPAQPVVSRSDEPQISPPLTVAVPFLKYVEAYRSNIGTRSKLLVERHLGGVPQVAGLVRAGHRGLAGVGGVVLVLDCREVRAVRARPGRRRKAPAATAGSP